MGTIAIGIGGIIAILLIIALALLFMVTRLFRKVEQGKALIISKLRKVDVTFTGAVVLPVLHKAEVMDISVKTIDVERTGRDGLICKDNIRADIRITFFVRVNKTVDALSRETSRKLTTNSNVESYTAASNSGTTPNSFAPNPAGRRKILSARPSRKPVSRSGASRKSRALREGGVSSTSRS